jgi:acyl carrier protein
MDEVCTLKLNNGETQMLNSTIICEICGIVAEVLEIDLSEVQPDVNLYTSLGVDSLAILSVFISIKRTFGVPEPSDVQEYQLLFTPRLVAEYVIRHPLFGNSR